MLAIDFGRKKVGLAISDESRSFAFRRGIIRDYASLEGLFKRIEEMCSNEGVETVVLGIPLGENGEETEQSIKIRDIGRRMREYIGKDDFVYIDESFSTFRAKGLKKEFPGEKMLGDDDYAAFLLLEEYLKGEGNDGF